MYSIVYHSTKSPDLTAKGISKIIKTSRYFNKKYNITGCLIYHNHSFIQSLEGDRTILEELYLKIKKDKRHCDVNTLYQDFTLEKNFKFWNMAFIDLSLAQNNINKLNLFETNLITYCELMPKTDKVSSIFWKKAKLILESKDE
jgi:hypothetical protein